MKKLLLMAVLCAGQMLTATAQTNPTTGTDNRVTMSNYERMLQNRQEVQFRTQAIKTLELSEAQIKDFDPLYSKYMDKKNDLAQERMKLLNNYVEEIAENDSPANEENDKEEFLEDYLELQVKEMELRKEYFDKMEDVITADNAFGFYLMEDIASNDLYLQILKSKFAPFMQGYSSTNPTYDSNGIRTNTDNNGTYSRTAQNTPNSSYNNSNSSNHNATLERSGTAPSNSNYNLGTNPSNSNNNTGYLNSNNNSGTNPTNSTYNRSTTGNDPMRNDNTTTTANTTAKSGENSYRTNIDTYSKWAKSSNGDRNGNHSNTQDGLNSLVSAITSLSMACNMSTDNTFTSNKNKIVANASQLQKDPRSMTHATLMRESFIMAADMLKTVQQQCAQTSGNNTETQVAQMAETARKIDVNRTTTSQEEHIRDFFQQAQVAIDGMAGSVKWTSK